MNFWPSHPGHGEKDVPLKVNLNRVQFLYCTLYVSVRLHTLGIRIPLVDWTPRLKCTVNTGRIGEFRGFEDRNFFGGPSI